LPLYRNSSLFLFPSLFENSPYALVEAMAAGLPVIATAGSGIGEIITHDDNGLLFPAEDRTMLVAHVEALFRDRERASRIGHNAAASIDRMFNPVENIAAHLEHYASVRDKTSAEQR
jgi:glycosyltransferase involved in cell wall biosynthesis